MLRQGTFRLRAVAAPILAVVLAASAQECDTGDLGDSEGKACDFRPRVTTELDARRMVVVAEATARCDAPPRAHTFTLKLETLVDIRGDKEIWQTRKSDYTTAIPRPGDPVGLKVQAGCWPGLWRANVAATGTSPNGKPFDFEDTTEREFTIDDCRRDT